MGPLLALLLHPQTPRSLDMGSIRHHMRGKKWEFHMPCSPSWNRSRTSPLCKHRGETSRLVYGTQSSPHIWVRSNQLQESSHIPLPQMHLCRMIQPKPSLQGYQKVSKLIAAIRRDWNCGREWSHWTTWPFSPASPLRLPRLPSCDNKAPPLHFNDSVSNQSKNTPHATQSNSTVSQRSEGAPRQALHRKQKCHDARATNKTAT